MKWTNQLGREHLPRDRLEGCARHLDERLPSWAGELTALLVRGNVTLDNNGVAVRQNGRGAGAPAAEPGHLTFFADDLMDGHELSGFDGFA